MNKDLKMLLISFVSLITVVVVLYLIDKQTCQTVEYQNLSGAHREHVCEWEK